MPTIPLRLTLIAALAWAPVAMAQTPQRVTIDVKPGDAATTLEIRDGMLPIALLSTAQFDAASTDPSTIRIGPTGTEAEPFRTMPEDVNRDGRPDLLILVRVQQLNLSCSDKAIRLKAETRAGMSIEGSEAIVVDGCDGR
jgi:hypothetical protein